MCSTARHQWVVALILIGSLGTIKEGSAGRAPVRVTRSAVESLRDHGTYIIHFESHVTKEEMQEFTTALERKSMTETNFAAEIVEEMFMIKCLTARLSIKALTWVRTAYVHL